MNGKGRDLANGARRTKANGEAAMPDPVEVLVWVFFAVALLGTLYCLMREEPDGSQATVARRAQERTQAQVRMLSLVVAALGAGCGLWQIFRHGGHPVFRHGLRQGRGIDIKTKFCRQDQRQGRYLAGLQGQTMVGQRTGG